MAKVKNQVYDGSEECYTDASGRFYGIGEFFRHIMTDAFPLPSVEPKGVVRKSPRGFRPSQQYLGSPAQLPFRRCFQQCSDIWNALPVVCPPCSPCNRPSSKKNIWDDKQAGGTKSSYYDHFMGCCMSRCVIISITGPDGITYSDGTIPDDIDCWPCFPNCKDATLSIGFTSPQMKVGQSQLLSAYIAPPCSPALCCQADEFRWYLLSGGGFLSDLSGYTTTYTAPDANENCEQNATITLTGCCGQTATLNIAINAVIGITYAFFKCTDRVCPTPCDFFLGPTCGSCVSYYSCDGINRTAAHSSACDCIGITEDVTTAMLPCNPVGYTDMRSDEQKAAGCCPYQLLP